MFQIPDEATLRLCALIVVLCFTATFLALRLRQPAQRFWTFWAAGGGAHCIGVVAFDQLPAPLSPVIGAMLYGTMGSSTLLLLAGVRVFAGLAAWRWWMTALVLVPPSLHATVAIAWPGATTPGMVALARLTGGIGLTIVLAACGAALVRGTIPAAIGGWSRAIGIAFFAYLPSYATVLVAAYSRFEDAAILARYLWMTQPVLMLAIDLTLLAMPGMVALERLRGAASRDGLTGLHNRYWLGQCEAARAARGTQVAMIDLDGFKGVNDRCGHAAGDALLVAFAAHLRRWAEAHRGAAVRLGGDEFLLLFPLDDALLAPALAKHIAAAPHGPDPLPPWSASVGIAPCPPGSAALRTAMQQADAALYQVKRDRRAARAQAA